MTTYIIRRLWQSVIVVFGVVTVVFFVLQLTGDPVRIMLGETASEEDIQNVKHQLGLDRPIPEQYVVFLSKAVRGDFGESIRQRGQPAMDIVMSRYPATLKLAFMALAVSVIMSTILGVISAVKRYTLIDNIVMMIALVGQSVPNFWLGIMLILIVAVQLGWLPSQGYGEGGVRYMILPMLTLAAPGLARLTRLVRSGMLDILGQDYVRTARAKGLNERMVLVRHAVRNALIPFTTVLGVQMGYLLGGTVITESVFALPGMGRLVLTAVLNRDYQVATGIIFLIASAFVIINLLVDLTYPILDPRVRLSRSGS